MAMLLLFYVYFVVPNCLHILHMLLQIVDQSLGSGG